MGEWSPAFGRKVLFINPGYILKTQIIPDLLEMEYEVYYTEEPRYAKSLLRQFPDSICFFDIDSGMTEDEYLHLILSIEQNPEFKNVLIGVISRKTGTVQKNFLLNVKLAAGYLPRCNNREEIRSAIAGVLELNEVKGRRQYVRISIPHGADATFSFMTNSKQMSLPIKDISSCGFACDAVGLDESHFTVNSVLQGKLILGQMILPCTAVLYALKPTNLSVTLVMLFASKGNSWNLKKNIKAYSAIQLQKVATAICVRGGLDPTDYTRVPDEAEKLEALADLEECIDDDFYADDDNKSGLHYTDITAAH